MAQDPLRPKDSGKIKLPKIDAGMNKLPPDDRGGGKGSDYDKENVKKGDDKDRHQKILARARKRFDKCVSAEDENRSKALDDRKFKNGEQWPSEALRIRNNRPCLTINKLPTFTKQVINDIRQNRPQIHVSPIGDRGDVEVAKMHRGIIRYIERQSAADIAYDTATQDAIDSGFGYFRILTEYDKPNSFKQTIRVKRVRNPFTVYLDCDHQEPDGSDSKYGFVTEMIPRDEFDELYPDAEPMSFSTYGKGELYKSWVEKDAIRVAEYYEIENNRRTLVLLSNGFEGWEDELSDEVKDLIDKGDLEIQDSRESDDSKIMYYKMTAIEILEENEWLGKWIPIVEVIGDELDIEGKRKLSGIIRHAKDPQRMYNYSASAEVELVALAPKAPFIGAEGQFEGHEAQWQQANTRDFPYLEYVPVALGDKPAPPPQRQPLVTAPQGWEVIKQGAAQDMMATTGIRFDSSKQERMYDESGKAIKELRRSSDLTQFNFGDNLSRSLRHAGNIYIDLIQKIYTEARIITILREDDEEERVRIDPNATKPYSEQRPQPTPQQPNPKVMKIFNPKYGDYGVTVTIGPSFATRRIEAQESMTAFAKAMPGVAEFVADLIVKNQDWDGAEEMHTRLAKVLALKHPGLMTPNMKDVPPQVQALLAGMDGQIKQLTQQLSAAAKALADGDKDRAITQDKINKDFEAKLLKVLSDIEVKMAGIQQKAEQSLNKDLGSEAVKLTEAVNAMTQMFQPRDPKPDPAILQLASSLGASHQQMAAGQKDLSGRMDKMLEHMSKPKKAKLKRADGSVVEISTE